MGKRHGSLDERARPIPREGSDRLLRAVAELRALEREKRLQEASSAPLHDLERRVEEKARAVFRLAQQEGGGTGRSASDDEPRQDRGAEAGI